MDHKYSKNEKELAELYYNKIDGNIIIRTFNETKPNNDYTWVTSDELQELLEFAFDYNPVEKLQPDEIENIYYRDRYNGKFPNPFNR